MKTHSLTCLILMAVALMACNSQPSAAFQGGLFFAQGAYVMRFSFQDGSLSVAGHLGDTVIREVSDLGEGDLLIAETASVNRRRVPRITWFDPSTGETADLFSGVLARHLPGPAMVVYDDGSNLFAVPQQSERPNQTVFSHAQNEVTGILAAGPDVLLFESEDKGAPLIRSWNAITGELVVLEGLTGRCRLEGAVWIGQLEQLLCRDRNGPTTEAGYLLVDLEGALEGTPEWPSDNEFRALTYIPDQGVLVLQEIWHSMLDSRDKYAVWLYDVESGESHRVAENVNLGQSVVFAEY